jgi:primary-amine oxidase
MLIILSSQDNTSILVEVLKPNKTDALAYHNGTSGPPLRWARAAMVHAGDTQSLIVNYMVFHHPAQHREVTELTSKVGPLPLQNDALLIPLEFCYNSDRNYVLNPLPDPATFQSWQSSFIHNYSDIIQTLLGAVYLSIYNNDNEADH